MSENRRRIVNKLYVQLTFNNFFVVLRRVRVTMVIQ
jgi:hypothetical protein